MDQSFATAFNDSVHAGLDKVLGHSGTEAVLVHMKMADGLPDPVEFHTKLLALFGPAGTLSLEKAIVKNLALGKSFEILEIDGVLDFNATIGLVQKGARASPQVSI
ncbi:MAG TPA: hypothetical protein VGS04_04050 [Nitrososphaerales archaeon]|nr:hypothetical protein [Nitrososphaerales archaeon]